LVPVLCRALSEINNKGLTQEQRGQFDTFNCCPG